MSFISPEDYAHFDSEEIIFEQAKQLQGEHGQKFHRIQIKYKYENGIGPLVIQTPILFTHGISTGTAAVKKENSAPQLSLVSYNPETGPTNEEKQFLTVCEKILCKVREHMFSDDTKEELGKWEMDADVKAMKIFYIKMEKGRPVKGYPPTLYSKLYYRIDDGEITITSRIDDANTGEPLPKRPLLGRGKVYATVIFSNIYIGSKPSIQTRIGEVMVVEKSERLNHLKPLVARSTEPAPAPVLRLKSLSKTK